MEKLGSDCSEQAFLSHFIQNAPQLMWFLGAGTSRSAGMPTATDIIWDLKRRYYCLYENQDVQSHDINNQAIRQKIQSYCDSKGFPPLGGADEYSFYFDVTFGGDYSSQQKYVRDQLAPEKISLNIGHRALAALLDMGLARVIFTTNFDEVIERAYAAVTSKNLTAFHLEGAYAVLDALNAERFPIYAKIHGDFRYRSIKNLASDLLHNNEEIQKSFLAAANRYGLVVAGYSGRDANVMAMFKSALRQNNPFPQGLFWTIPRLSDVAAPVRELIDFAREKGVRAHIVESRTFDVMLSKIWRQVPHKPEKLDAEVRTAKLRRVSVPLPRPGESYPILRANALAITECPRQCVSIDYAAPITFQELNDRKREYQPNAILSYTDRIIFWGDRNEITKVIDKDKVRRIQPYRFDDPVAAIKQSGAVKSFFEQALARSLCDGKPMVLRRKGSSHYLVVSQRAVGDPIFQPLKSALGHGGKPGEIAGLVPQLSQTSWAEALSIKLEEKNGFLWLLIRPEIWITPLSMRESAADFLRDKRRYRYNIQSYALLDAWIRVLFGSIGEGQEVRVSCFPGTESAPEFKVNTRTAFSRAGGRNA